MNVRFRGREAGKLASILDFDALNTRVMGKKTFINFDEGQIFMTKRLVQKILEMAWLI